MLQLKDAAVEFLKDTKRELDTEKLAIATMLAEGRSCRQIGMHLSIDPIIAQRFGHKIKDTILREQRAKKAPERLESLITTIKASKRPLCDIPIHGLLPGRFEDALYRAHIIMLGDAAARGKAKLLAIINFGGAGVDALEKILVRFNAKLAD